DTEGGPVALAVAELLDDTRQAAEQVVEPGEGPDQGASGGFHPRVSRPAGGAVTRRPPLADGEQTGDVDGPRQLPTACQAGMPRLGTAAVAVRQPALGGSPQQVGDDVAVPAH